MAAIMQITSSWRAQLARQACDRLGLLAVRKGVEGNRGSNRRGQPAPALDEGYQALIAMLMRRLALWQTKGRHYETGLEQANCTRMRFHCAQMEFTWIRFQMRWEHHVQGSCLQLIIQIMRVLHIQNIIYIYIQNLEYIYIYNKSTR